MNKELKKGVLDICVLSYIKKNDRYGYQIVKELEDRFNVKESTIYPILKRLHRDKLLKTYLKESTNGPARKYHSITQDGEIQLEKLLKEWNDFVAEVMDYLK